ncbi:DnaA ATPase domain-containing protein [Bacillus sp. SD088]|uniref:DnaA ATPase domain-containing protein n=1 Tax=Bacillus sp. SD088 TaxID=2782012 RepID=UPI001A965600|nr:DnaA/Hda family protein [Bacillus sp. SD088]MBO0992564.1 ATP-binding protein [Bacillus sp. SD088]
MKVEDGLWDRILSSISKQINEVSFETWFKHTGAFRDGNKWIITTNNDFAQLWLEENYRSIIEDTIENITNEKTELTFENNEKPQPPFANTKNKVLDIWLQIAPLNMAEKRKLYGLLKNHLFDETTSVDDIDLISNINPSFTFENFTIDSSNQFTVAAAEAVISDLGKAYNPLFIYGPTGSGKTHLLHAIGNKILENKKNAKIICFNSTQFTNAFMDSITRNKHKEFKGQIHQADVLLLDDADLLAGKDQSQEEFFHLFNNFYEESKQIIMTSTRSPKEIPAISERLTSRFEWGLVTSIDKVKAQQAERSADVDPSISDILRRVRHLELEMEKLSSLIESSIDTV